MRSFWLSVTVIAAVLLLVSFRVEGGRRSAVKKEAAPPFEPKSEVAFGYGETKKAARRVALERAQEWIEQEVRGQLKPDWSFPREKLERDALEEQGIIKEVKEPAPDENAGGAWRAEVQVNLTQEYVDDVYKAARKEFVSEEKRERLEQVERRRKLLLPLLGGAAVVLLVVTGYLRLEEATRGYYTGVLRAVAIAVVLLAVLTLVIIG